MRFVLDHLEANNDNPWYYTEDAHPPPFHAYETLKVSGKSVSATPMILFEENGKQQVMHDSTNIIKKFMPQLYPKEIQDEVEQVERDLGQRLGATLRCFSNYHLLSDPKRYHETLVKMCADPNKVAKIESFFYDAFLERGLADGMRTNMGINKELSDASAVTVRTVFMEWSKRLEETGGEYLLDTKEKSFGFTAADLTLAALAFPLFQPPQVRDWCFNHEPVPDALKDMRNELIATKAGQHVLKIYKQHRIPDGGGGDEDFVTMKYADRSKWFWASRKN